MTRHTLILGTLLLLPLVAHADDDRQCKESQPRNLQLDFKGVDTVVFDIGANDTDVRATPGATGKVEGRACASDVKGLERLKLTQEKSGNKLVVRAEREDWSGISFGNHYAYMKLQASVPDTVLVQMKVGSGDASVEGARATSADVGSGDIRVARIHGEFTAAVGSGDLDADDVGAFHLLSIGSGDVKVRHVRGASKIGSIGSGDLEISNTQGAVEIGSVGSGDVDLNDIGGNVSVGSIGSGDLGVHDVRGNLSVRSTGSGDVNHSGVSGDVDLPRKR